MSFGVRGTGGGESVCKGTGQTHFVREPVRAFDGRHVTCATSRVALWALKHEQPARGRSASHIQQILLTMVQVD